MSGETAAAIEKLPFQTEAKQLLHLMIHSLYSHKEVFLRELISNASDALDRVRFESLTNPGILGEDKELAVHIRLDTKAKTITVSDNGLGMTRQEVIDNIGTIARSGSRAFLEKLTGDQKADSNLIGRFGVGFYSVFMAASSVKLVTRRAGSTEPAVVWESDGVSDYTIRETSKAGRGTEITVYLKEGETNFSEEWQVRSLIRKYSDYIAFPIYLPNDKGKDEIVNEIKPIWTRSPSEVKQEHYEEFYQQALGGFDKPLCVLHGKAEGVMEYSSLLFIPEKAAFDLFHFEQKHGVKLYVKRVFIMDNCKELLPQYLRFVKGIVDSEDLPLNVSREMLQENPVVARIRKSLVSRILGKITELSEKEPDKFRTLWQQFGPVIKEGLHTDAENRDKLLDIIRFQSSMGASKNDLVSLKQYAGRMREGQKDIYYITGESRESVEKSPHLEVFRAKSIEVLYLVDPIDEFVVPQLYSYEGKQLKSVAKGDLDLGDLGKEETGEKKKVESAYKKLTERIKNILSDDVKEARVATRLKESPCCLVTDENDASLQMEKIMKAMGHEVPKVKRTLEINGNHPLIAALNALYEKDAKSGRLEELVNLLYDQALIAEGESVKDPAAFAKRLSGLLLNAAKNL
jgi:molecular chaperone HtpG